MFRAGGRKFWPLFQTQFAGAFNDNMLKNALVLLLTYRLTGYDVPDLVTIAGSLLVVPSIIFSATAGELADKFDKAMLTRCNKIAEIAVMLVATAGFALDSVPVVFVALTGIGLQSTFFGPIKLSILPQLLEPDELLAGNSYIESGTFLAILLGTLAGGVLVLLPGGSWIVSGALLAVAVAGYAVSRRIPPALPPDPGLRIHWNIVGESVAILRYAARERAVFACILAISWFWLVGASYISEVAPFTKDLLGGPAGAVTVMLTVFSVGVGLGSFLCSRLFRDGTIRLVYAAPAALAISLFGGDLFFAAAGGQPPAVMTLGAFLHTLRCWRVIIDFFAMAVAGGIYIVPLYAQIQHVGTPSHLARLIGATNICTGIFMLASTLATIGLLAVGLTIPSVFLVVAVANLLAAAAMLRAWNLRRA